MAGMLGRPSTVRAVHPVREPDATVLDTALRSSPAAAEAAKVTGPVRATPAKNPGAAASNAPGNRDSADGPGNADGAVARMSSPGRRRSLAASGGTVIPALATLPRPAEV